MNSDETPSEKSTVRQPLTALDLANLAARICPELCRTDPKTAFLEAFAFYQMAALFVEENQNKEFVRLYLDNADFATTGVHQPFMHAAVAEISEIVGKANIEKNEREKLRLDPKAHTDPVREFLGVKSDRAVYEKLKKWFLFYSKTHGEDEAAGIRHFEEFMLKAARKDDDGTVYHAIGERVLKGIKSLEREIKRAGGLKAIEQTKLADQIPSEEGGLEE